MKYLKELNPQRQTVGWWFPGAGGGAEWGVTSDGFQGLRSDENVLELEVVIAQLVSIPNTTELCTLEWLFYGM